MEETKTTATCDADEKAKLMLLSEIFDLAQHVYDLRDAVEHICHYNGKPIVVLTAKAFYALFATAEYKKGDWSFNHYGNRWERSLRYELPGIVYRATEKREAEMPAKPED